MIHILDPKRARPNDGITPLSSFFPAQAGHSLDLDIIVMALIEVVMKGQQDHSAMLKELKKLQKWVGTNILEAISVFVRASRSSNDREVCQITYNWLGDLIGKIIFYHIQLGQFGGYVDPMPPEDMDEPE